MYEKQGASIEVAGEHDPSLKLSQEIQKSQQLLLQQVLEQQQHPYLHRMKQEQQLQQQQHPYLHRMKQEQQLQQQQQQVIKAESSSISHKAKRPKGKTALESCT